MSGIIQGIAIGLTVGVVLKLVEFGTHVWLRRGEICHIRKLVENARDRIYGAKAIPPSPGELFSVSVNEVRWVIYQSFHKNLISALRERCGHMSYDQIHSVNDAFLHLEFVEGLEKVNSQKVAAPSVYFRLFKQLENIEWLGLPPIQPPSDAEE